MNTASYLPTPAELYSQWKQDRELQCRMPLRQMWRGVLGLALMVSDFDKNAVAVGEKTFLPNHAVKWLAVQDIPPGHFPLSRTWNHFGVTLALETAASLAYGFPRIDFSGAVRDAINLKIDPLRSDESAYSPAVDLLRDRRRAAVMLNITTAMTEAAYYGVDRWCAPLRPLWHYERPFRGRSVEIEEPAVWMPRAYGVFEVAKLRQIAPGEKWLLSHIEGLGVEVSKGLRAIPFGVIANRLRVARPIDMLWDVSPCADYLSCSLETFVFPPMRLQCHDQKQLQLPGVVQMNVPAFCHKAQRSPVALTADKGSNNRAAA